MVYGRASSSKSTSTVLKLKSGLSGVPNIIYPRFAPIVAAPLKLVMVIVICPFAVSCAASWILVKV